MTTTLSQPAKVANIQEKVAFLQRSDVYPAFTSTVEVVETHMSWVFLTDQYAYKLKKPVRYDFLDFSTPEKRRWDCQEEVRLNRRLANDVYLGVVSLTVNEQGQLNLEGNEWPIDWLVKMHRLPRDRMLDNLLSHNAVSEDNVRAFTKVLSEFYQSAQIIEVEAGDYRQRFEKDIHATLKELSDPTYKLPCEQKDKIAYSLLQFIAQEPKLFDGRIEEKRIIEAHGDLRPEHVCLINPPVFIDCLEFNREFRILDTVDELAYLTMECDLLGATFVSDIVFSTYGEITGDCPDSRLVNFYKAARALLRAKLAIWHIKDHDVNEHAKWTGKARAYLRIAESYVVPLVK